MSNNSDSYLQIAEKVLDSCRVPMSTQEIMREAYLRYLVPTHLHGKTQHKTLGARLSEDILQFRDKSRFYRNRPGRFFLRKFMTDRSIPREFRKPIVARRRKLELKNRNIVHFQRELIWSIAGKNRSGFISPAQLKRIIKRGDFVYRDLTAEPDNSLIPFYSFTYFKRKNGFLGFDRGSFREQRSDFIHKRSLGFTVPVEHDDMTLFEFDNHGVINAGLTAAAIDLDLEFSRDLPYFENNSKFSGCLFYERPNQHALLGIVKITSPEFFYPETKRLAINELGWVDLCNIPKHNFDPWTEQFLNWLQEKKRR